MTEPDTTALRALAERIATPTPGAVTLDIAVLRALCDGYDEAQRLRGEVEVYSDLSEVLGAANVRAEAAEQALAAMSEAARIDTAAKVALVADLTAARQALADLIGELRGLCEHKTGWDFIDPEDVRAVIDRYDPEATS